MPDPGLEIRGRVSKNYFSALRASVGSKNKRGAPRAPPLDPPLRITLHEASCTSDYPSSNPLRARHAKDLVTSWKNICAPVLMSSSPWPGKIEYILVPSNLHLSIQPIRGLITIRGLIIEFSQIRHLHISHNTPCLPPPPPPPPPPPKKICLSIGFYFSWNHYNTQDTSKARFM